MWYGERINKRKNSKNPSFSLCCGQGQVVLPLLKDPPTELKRLIEGDDPRCKHFQKLSEPITWSSHLLLLVGKLKDL